MGTIELPEGLKLTYQGQLPGQGPGKNLKFSVTERKEKIMVVERVEPAMSGSKLLLETTEGGAL